jgi:hypothetical protein
MKTVMALLFCSRAHAWCLQPRTFAIAASRIHGGGYRAGPAFHGGGVRYGGIRYGGYRSSGYRYGGFRHGGFRFAHHHRFHRRFYGPAYYDYPCYYAYRRCHVIWTYYGPRRVCHFRHWHHHYWRHHHRHHRFYY